MLTKASKVLDRIENAMAAIGGVLLLFTTFIVVLEIFSRSFFHHSFIWIYEITEYILLYIPFLGGAWLLRTNGHIVVDIVDLIAGRRTLHVLSIIVTIIGLFVCSVIVYFSLLTLNDLYVRDVRSITVLKIPQIYVYVIIPFGTFFMGLEFIRKLYRIVTRATDANGQGHAY